MTKKANVGLTGAETSLAAALLNAGVKPASDSTVPAAAPATPTSAPAADADAAASAPNPTSADAAIAASALVDGEIAAVKVVWEHAKSTGISKEQFLKLLEIDPPKLAFAQQHKKAIFGSKKNQLSGAAAAVIAANVTASGSGKAKRSKSKTKRSKSVKSFIRALNHSLRTASAK